MQIFEGKVDNQGVSIHYIESFVDSTVEIAADSIVEVIVETKERPPLLIVPGFTESAEDYIEIIRAFEDRKCTKNELLSIFSKAICASCGISGLILIIFMAASFKECSNALVSLVFFSGLVSVK